MVIRPQINDLPICRQRFRQRPLLTQNGLERLQNQRPLLPPHFRA